MNLQKQVEEGKRANRIKNKRHIVGVPRIEDGDLGQSRSSGEEKKRWHILDWSGEDLRDSMGGLRKDEESRMTNSAYALQLVGVKTSFF